MASWLQQGTRLLRHRWCEARLRTAVPDSLVETLTQQVAASEQRHTGQVRICVEAGLPAAYVWRSATAHERAVALFGKLRVWDTEHNNGVLIYLLLADRAIEIVADRGLTKHVSKDTWDAVIADMRQALRAGNYEQALAQAIERVSRLLVEYFPVEPGAVRRSNELPDTPVLSGNPLLKK